MSRKKWYSSHQVPGHVSPYSLTSNFLMEGLVIAHLQGTLSHVIFLSVGTSTSRSSVGFLGWEKIQWQISIVAQPLII